MQDDNQNNNNSPLQNQSNNNPLTSNLTGSISSDSTNTSPPPPSPQAVDLGSTTESAQDLSTSSTVPPVQKPSTGSLSDLSTPSSLDTSQVPPTTSTLSEAPQLSVDPTDNNTIAGTKEIPTLGQTATTSEEPVSTPSILNPKDNNNEDLPSIVPGTPGNTITPPKETITSTGVDTSTSTGTSTISTPTLDESSSSGMLSTPTDSPASSQPLSTRPENSDKPTDLSNMPLRSPPMPGTQNPENEETVKPAQTGTPPSPSAVISTSDTKSGGKFKVFVILLIIITIIVYGVVAYLYFTGDSNENSSSDLSGNNSNSQQISQTNQETTPENTPTPVITEAFTINNGDVVKESSIGDVTVLVKKNDYPESGIIGFSSVSQSPDKSRLCFYSLSPADDPSLYISNSSGAEVEKIASKVSSCVWSTDSKKLAYTNTADSTSPVDIYVYDTTNTESNNFTSQETANEVFRRYEIEQWNQDSSQINCNYIQINTLDTNEETLGKCKIDITSAEVLDL